MEKQPKWDWPSKQKLMIRLMHLEKTFYTYRKFQKLQANDAISLHYYFGKTLILENSFKNGLLYSFACSFQILEGLVFIVQLAATK